MRLPEDATLVFTTGAPPAWATKLRFYKHPEFERRVQIPPPTISDRLNENAPCSVSANASNDKPHDLPASTLKNGAANAPTVSDSARLL
jgi:type IV secretory pathway TraG/TraD family ATPase VirD4